MPKFIIKISKSDRWMRIEASSNFEAADEFRPYTGGSFSLDSKSDTFENGVKTVCGMLDKAYSDIDIEVESLG